MNKDAEVYFFANSHPINESYILDSPGGVRFRSNLNESSFGKVIEYSQINRFGKSMVNRITSSLKIPRQVLIPKKADIFHTQGGVIPVNGNKFIVTIEHASSFFSLNDDAFQNPSYRKNLLKKLSSKECCYVAPYSDATKKSLINALGNDSSPLLEKMEVVYPAISTKLLKRASEIKKNKGENIRLLFVSRHFFDDGGRELVNAFEALKSKFDLELTIITNPPSNHRPLFHQFLQSKSHLPNLNIIEGSINRDDLFNNYYNNADIFILPSYIHFFGFVCLEAMTFGLPIIGTDVYAMPEIVENEKNGYIVHTPISCFNDKNLKPTEYVLNYRSKILNFNLNSVTNQLIDRISVLIENDKIRSDMGKKSREFVENGKFSATNRNKILTQMYLNSCNC